MKANQLIILLFSLLFFLNSCENGNEQMEMDLLRNKWKVQYVANESKRFHTPDETFREEAYILKFVNDSIFVMNTSVNYAGGKYQIVSEGSIIISHYGEKTEVGNANEYQRFFDKQLLAAFNGVMTYSYNKNKLIFQGEQNREIVFVKQKP